MQIIDFEYNGERLSEHGLSLCNFSSSNDTFNIGNQIEIRKVKAANSYKYMGTGYEYDDVFTFDLSACRTPCKNNSDDYFTDIETRKIVRWLNRKRFCKFVPIYDDNSFADICYYGTFNIELEKEGSNVAGFNMTFTSNAPFGFAKEITMQTSLNANGTWNFDDTSDEIGFIYGYAEIECLQAGTLKITNSLDPSNAVIIENCIAGEVIKLDGEKKTIESYNSNHDKLFNDFNYRFLRVANKYEDITNVFSSTLNCKISITYSPIRKVGIVL